MAVVGWRATVLLAGLPLLWAAGCSGGLGTFECTSDSTIAFTGPVRTEATVGFAYHQGLAASASGLLGTMHGIEPVSVPAGTAVSAGGVSWTPGPDHAGTTQLFRVRSEIPDLCGAAASIAWSVRVYPAVEVTRLEATPAVVSTRGAPVQLLAEFSGGTGALVGPFTAPLRSGVPIDVGVVTTATTFTIAVTSPAGDVLERAVAVEVRLPPTIVGLAASPATVTEGDPLRLSWALGGHVASLVLDPGGIALQPWTTSIDLPSAAPATYTLTARNEVGDVATASITPVVVPPPAILSLQATPSSPPVFGSTEVVATFTGGAGRLVVNVEGATSAPIDSGVPLAVGPLRGTADLILTVTSPAGRSAERWLRVSLSGPGSWEPLDLVGGPPWASRSGALATPLADGRVLVAGGSEWSWGGATEQAPTWLLDPASRTVAAGPPLLHPREGHAAVALAGGRVLLAGGHEASGRPVDEAELLDLAAGTAAAAGPVGGAWYFPRALALPDGSAVVHSASIYSTGGQPVLRLDPATGLLAPLATAYDLGWTEPFLLPSGQVLLLGGGRYALSPSQLLDPATGRLTPTGATLSVTASFGAVQLADGSVLVFDGSPAERFDPATGLFTAVGTPGTRPFGAGGRPALLPDGRVLLVAGTDCGLFDATTGASTETGCPVPGGQLVRLPGGAILSIGREVERYRGP